MGEDDVRGLTEEADIDGPLVDSQAKGNKIEYLGHDQVDGDDAYKLKVTLKNGDIFTTTLTRTHISRSRSKSNNSSAGRCAKADGDGFLQAGNGVIIPSPLRAARRTILTRAAKSTSTRSK